MALLPPVCFGSALRAVPGPGPGARASHSTQAERDLRPSKIQEKISGRLTDLTRTADRYLLRGVLSTATKHEVNHLAVLRDAFTVTTRRPPAAATLT